MKPSHRTKAPSVLLINVRTSHVQSYLASPFSTITLLSSQHSCASRRVEGRDPACLHSPQASAPLHGLLPPHHFFLLFGAARCLCEPSPARAACSRARARSRSRSSSRSRAHGSAGAPPGAGAAAACGATISGTYGTPEAGPRLVRVRRTYRGKLPCAFGTQEAGTRSPYIQYGGPEAYVSTQAAAAAAPREG